ncbi:6494_t:CDS:2, partial [Ambispora leptoticha]
ITDSSYAALMTAKFDVNKTLAFWTPERMKSAKPLMPKNIGFRNKTRSGAKNAKIMVDDDDQTLSMDPFDNPNNPLNYPIGMLFFSDPETGEPQVCTASVFNTENGNIGMTAAHCLFNDDGIQFNNIAFSPGFDDPDGFTLQQYTGANGWRLGLEDDNIVTTVFGYPQNGDMPDCPKDGFHLCVMVNTVERRDTEYVIPGVNLGDGVSGAPWTIEHDPNRNLGYMYGNHAFYNTEENQSESTRYNPEDFNDLLEYVSEN